MKDRLEEPLYPEKEVKRILYMILSGLNHIHNNNVVHRDLKPENCILDKDFNIRIIDFGMSKPVSKVEYGKLMIGTQAFMAPELFDMDFDNRAYKCPIDVWAAGIMMYQLLCGE